MSLRRLGKACELLDTICREMVTNAEKKTEAFQNELEDLVAKMAEQDKAPQYIVGIHKMIKSWLSYNDITLSRGIAIRNPSLTPSIENERVLSQDELAKIMMIIIITIVAGSEWFKNKGAERVKHLA